MSTLSDIIDLNAAQQPAARPDPRSELGWWHGGDLQDIARLPELLGRIRTPLFIVGRGEEALVGCGGSARLGADPGGSEDLPIRAWVPALDPARLGDPGFCADHGIRLPYMTGSMANGIASVPLVAAVARSGMLASFGAAGLDVDRIEQAIHELAQQAAGRPYCFNLIHSPNEKDQEERVVDLYLRHGIRRIEASAYLGLTLPVVRYRVSGLHRNSEGVVEAPNRIIAKASRVEVASRWFSPPPEKLLRQLVEAGRVSAEEAELAAEIPMARDLTVEADSGGHTDNRPAITLLPTMIALRDRIQGQYGYERPLRVGAAGGIATPFSAAAAFSMGAAYVVTGTINQACVESGSSDLARQMLAEAAQADTAMAPAVDMFEMGVKLQVLKRGTMFAMRGNKLYELYRSYDSIDAIPADVRRSVEETIFRCTFEEVWEQTREYFAARDPGQIERAERDPRYKLSLACRWYLGLSSRWANAGEASRQVDYQIWCGPAMGAFNEWTRGTRLEQPANRGVVDVALNIMYGAAVATRASLLRSQGVPLPTGCPRLEPMEPAAIEEMLS